MGYRTIKWDDLTRDQILQTLLQISNNPQVKMLDVLSYIVINYPGINFDFVEGFKAIIPMRISEYSSDELLDFGKLIGLSKDKLEGNSFFFWYFVLRRIYLEGKAELYRELAKNFFLTSREEMAFIVYEEMVYHAILNEETELLAYYSECWDKSGLTEIPGSFLRECIEVYRQANVLELIYKRDGGFKSSGILSNDPLIKKETASWSDREKNEIFNLVESHHAVSTGKIEFKAGQDFYENYWSLMTYFMNYMKEELDIPFYQSFLMAMLNQMAWNKKKFRNPWMKGVVDIMEGCGFGSPGDKVSFITYRNFISFHGICYFYEFLYTAGQLNEKEYDQIILNLKLARKKIYQDFIPNLWAYKSVVELPAPECFEEEEIMKEREVYHKSIYATLEDQHKNIEKLIDSTVLTKGIQNYQYA